MERTAKGSYGNGQICEVLTAEISPQSCHCKNLALLTSYAGDNTTAVAGEPKGGGTSSGLLDLKAFMLLFPLIQWLASSMNYNYVNLTGSCFQGHF